MFFNRNNNLDERQLLIRGNIFKHCLFILIGLLLANTLLYELGIEWASGKWPELTIILFVIILCRIEFICYDIYPMSQKTDMIMNCFFGLYGVTSVIICIYDLLNENTGIIIDGKLASSALGIIYGIMFISVFIAYKIKIRYNARHEIN